MSALRSLLLSLAPCFQTEICLQEMLNCFPWFSAGSAPAVWFRAASGLGVGPTHVDIEGAGFSQGSVPVGGKLCPTQALCLIRNRKGCSNLLAHILVFFGLFAFCFAWFA